jgi:hypothetical protein
VVEDLGGAHPHGIAPVDGLIDVDGHLVALPVAGRRRGREALGRLDQLLDR